MKLADCPVCSAPIEIVIEAKAETPVKAADVDAVTKTVPVDLAVVGTNVAHSCGPRYHESVPTVERRFDT